MRSKGSVKAFGWVGCTSVLQVVCVCFLGLASFDIRPMECQSPCMLAVGGGCQSVSFARDDRCTFRTEDF